MIRTTGSQRTLSGFPLHQSVRMSDMTAGATALVSIVLTTLNAEQYMRECLDSCLQQTYPHFELIVVDGGSVDGTLDILRTYSDPRIRLVHQQGNRGKLAGA